ncbi:VirB4 family type IV secretion system protein [Kineosporia babensis]|uniref:DUF87 domain-containing protein n=1 Tax=Kineosporia babensis TaxID=499548 RepID=A0A9X1NPI1_9ACTN|nr:DUF87 domain-containing protein [Kineosporia babensis]MCD5316896.1 DUF87 domain-containing protein [Kineosporia babensis]
MKRHLRGAPASTLTESLPAPSDPSSAAAPDRREDVTAGGFDDEVLDGDDLAEGEVLVTATCLRVRGTWSASLVVDGFPPEVSMAWLSPLTSWPGVVDVSLHVEPIPTATAMSRIRRRRVRMESTRRLEADKGALEDPLTEAASQDAGELADKVARGVSRLFFTSLVLTVHARSREGLQEDLEDLRAAAAAMLLNTHVLTWRQEQGWVSSLPVGANRSGSRRIMDTDALAAASPLSSADLPGPLPGEPAVAHVGTGGVLMGLNLVSGAVVGLDRWSLDNHNMVVLARSGAGKSYAVKVSILRELYRGTQVSVIDPEREYLELAEQVGGRVIELGAPGVQVNPLTLAAGDPDAYVRRCLFVHTLIDVLLGEVMSPHEKAVLDVAVRLTYARAGITAEPRTWSRGAPSMRDLVTALHDLAEGTDGVASPAAVSFPRAPVGETPGQTQPGAEAGTGAGAPRPAPSPGADRLNTAGAPEAAAALAARLAPWVTGSFSRLFDAPAPGAASPGEGRPVLPAETPFGAPQGAPSRPEEGHLVVWSTRLLAEELRPAGMLLAIDAIWRSVDRGAPAGERAPTTRADAHMAEGHLREGHQGTAHGGTGAPEMVPLDGHEQDARGGTRPRRLVVVDEASLLLSEPAGARFLARLAKTSRKRVAGLTLITPDVLDLLGSDLGQVILANAASVLLLHQSPQAIGDLTRACALSPGEAQFLTTARRGQALLLAEGRVPLEIVASALEHQIAAAPPRDLHEPAHHRT